MTARSSESSLTIVLTVEYRMGLAQPATPNKYQQKNLERHTHTQVSHQSGPGRCSAPLWAGESTHFSACGMFQTIMHSTPNKTKKVWIV